MRYVKEFNNQMIKIWLSTYIIVLIIPLAVNYFLFVQTKVIIDEEIESSRAALIESMKNEIDEELFLLKQTGVLMGQDAKTLTLISDDRKELLESNKYTIIEYLEFIRIVVGSFKGKLVLLHLGNSDGVLFNNTYSEGKFFYENYLDKEIFPSYESWSNLIEDKYKNDYFKININTRMGLEEKYIAYGSSLPFGSLQNTSSTLLTLINQKLLIGILDQYKISEKGHVFIVDDKNQVVLSNSEDTDFDVLEYESLIANGHSQYGQIDGSEVVMMVEESDHLKWKYVIVSDKEVYLEKNNRYKKVVIISVGFYLVLGLFLAVWFSRRNYKPIGHMVSLVSHHSKDKDVKVGKSYEYLTTAFEEAFFKMDALEIKVAEQNNVMRNNFLYRLLSGIVIDTDIIEESLVKYNFNYTKPDFYTVIMSIDIKSQSESSNSLGTYIKLAEYFKAIPALLNDSDYIIRNSYIIYVVNSEVSNQEEIKEALYLMIDQLQIEMTDLVSIDISVGISNTHEMISSLAEAYTESMNCLEYSLLYDPKEVLIYKDIVSRGAYYYPLSIEQKLINYMKSGQVEEATTTLDEIFYTNFDQNKIGINMGRNLLFDISSSMLKAIDTVAMNEMNLSKDILHAVMFTKGIGHTKEKIKDSLIEVCLYYQEQLKTIEKTSYYEEINQFIDSHYKNPDLNISMIAEQFNLTPSYLSKLYKQESGESILNYISKVRVEEAKHLLVDSELTNIEVAMAVGILNDTSFNRVFKNIEGITPGKYRKYNT